MGSQDDLFRRFRRELCFLLAPGGFLFAVAVIVNNPTAVGVLGGVPAMAASGFAVGSLVAAKRQYAVERLWVSLALLTFAVLAVVVIHLIWL